MRKEFIRPAPGRVVRDHKDGMRQLQAEGKMVDFDTVWAKRVKEGDAIIGKAEAPSQPKELKAKPSNGFTAPAPVDKSTDGGVKAKETK